MDFRGFSAWEWLALLYFVDYGIEANVLRFMAGFTLIWFNSCQLWAPSRCLCFAGHLDRFGPDNAQLLEIFLDISHQWGSAVLYQKRLFPGAGASGELSSDDVTHLSSYRIQTQHEYTAHFEMCNTFWFRLTLFPDSLLGTPLLVPVIEMIHSHLVRDGHAVMATVATKEETCKPEVWMDLVQEFGDI